MSFGRYGAESGATKKVSLEITVDKWISDALGKIRTKKSVSNMINGLLAIVIRQFDPGPSSPLVIDLERLLARHRRAAEAAGDSEMVASVELLRSQLEPYIDLAEVGPYSPGVALGLSADITHLGKGTEKDGSRLDYDWFAVPLICHETPMVYLRSLNSWRCSACGSVCRDR